MEDIYISHSIYALIAFFWLRDTKWTLIDAKLEYPVTYYVVHCQDRFVAIGSLGEIFIFSATTNTDGSAPLMTSPCLNLQSGTHLSTQLPGYERRVVPCRHYLASDRLDKSKVEDAEDIVFFISKNFNTGFGVASISNISWNCVYLYEPRLWFVAVGSLREISIFSGSNTDGVAPLIVSPLLFMPLPAHIYKRSYLDMNSERYLFNGCHFATGQDMKLWCGLLDENSWWSKVEDAEDMAFFVSKHFNTGFGVENISMISWNHVYLFEPRLCHQDQEYTDNHHMEMVDVTTNQSDLQAYSPTICVQAFH
uniref:DUF295 domain-containing protein n=1 Tax=Oryza punctata TaxID=4537 RepID=A0A0E0KMQ1_ORYPU